MQKSNSPFTLWYVLFGHVVALAALYLLLGNDESFGAILVLGSGALASVGLAWVAIEHAAYINRRKNQK